MQAVGSPAKTDGEIRNPSTTHFHENNQQHAIAFSFQPSYSPGQGPLRKASTGTAYRCQLVEGRAATLPTELLSPGLFDFATQIKSNLKTLVIGDSVRQQLSEVLDESMGIFHRYWDVRTAVTKGVGYRQVLQSESAGRGKETLSISLPTIGGIISSYWRMTDIWSSKN